MVDTDSRLRSGPSTRDPETQVPEPGSLESVEDLERLGSRYLHPRTPGRKVWAPASPGRLAVWCEADDPTDAAGEDQVSREGVVDEAA